MIGMYARIIASVAVLLLAVSATFNGLLAAGVFDRGKSFNVDAYRAGIQEGYGDCLGGRDPDREVLAGRTHVGGEEWLYGTTHFAYGYDVGFTACQFESSGYDQGYDEGYTSGYEDGYSDGIDSGYLTGYGDGQEDLCQAIVTVYNSYGIPLPVDCSAFR